MSQRISLDALTGMRFLAALCVLIHHAIGHYPAVKSLNLPLGNASVSFFFVLSGFILTYAYDGRLNTWADLRFFWFTRWARIWPLHLVCWIYAVATSIGFYYLAKNQVLLSKAMTQFFLLQSWIPDYSWAFVFNDVSWSISDEAFFYLIFPLLFILSTRRFAWAVSISLALILCAVGLAQYFQKMELLPAWFNPITFTHLNPAVRCYDFLLGMVAGRVYISRRGTAQPRGFWPSTFHESLAIGVVVLVWWFGLRQYPLYLINKAPYLGPVIRTFVSFSGLALFFAYAIYVFASSRGLWCRFSALPVMVYLGEISFSLYMCHALVIKTLQKAIPETMADGALGLVFGLVLSLSILVSIFLYHLVELPAKAGLLAFYRGRYQSGLVEVFRFWRGFWISPRAWLAALFGMLVWFYVKSLS